MVEVTGSFSGAVAMQTAVGIPDHPLHAFVIASVCGRQKSSDGYWDGAKLTYWGMGDLTAGAGKQNGYFQNEHTNGDTTFGKFEGDVTVSSMQSRIEGTWTLTSGTGKFQGITGGGKFTATSTDPVTVHMEWSGDYTITVDNVKVVV